jgi:hypothetical protein
MIKLETVELEVLREEKVKRKPVLGRVEIEISQHSLVISERIFDDVWRRQEQYAAYYQGKIFGSLCRTVEFKEGYFVEHQPFALIKASGSSVARSYPSMRQNLYFDTTGYGAVLEDDKIVSYSPLLYQSEDGYCVAAVKRSVKVGGKKAFWNKPFSAAFDLVSTELLCEKMKWQDMIPFARPYNACFEAADVVEVEAKTFMRGNHTCQAVPLYLGKQCVAVMLPGDILGRKEYISYREYMQKF